jgi:hypothetical protein
MVKLSALSARHLLGRVKITSLQFCATLSRLQGHAAGRILLIEKLNDLIGYATRSLPACSAYSAWTSYATACCVLSLNNRDDMRYISCLCNYSNKPSY